MEIKVRKGRKEDLTQVIELVKELAIFEKSLEEVENTIELMEKEGFSDRPAFEFFVAENDSKIIGMALYFFSYSTWKGRSMYLDDLIVAEKFRGKGVGKMLFARLIEVAKAEDCGKLHWQVLDWNTPAIDYYKSLNARLDESWINCWLDRAELQKF